MNFREWLLKEINDIATRDAGNIQFLDKGGGYYVYEFSVNGLSYKLYLEKTQAYYVNMDSIYSIGFKGPNDYYITGQSGTSSNVVYTKLLLGLKKFMETHEVNGFYFTAAHPSMALVYKRFFDQFLKGTFIQIDRETYVRKDKLKAFYDTLPNSDKSFHFKRMIKTRREVNAKLKNTKREKNLRRHLSRNIGSFIYIQRYSEELCYFYSMAPHQDDRILIIPYSTNHLEEGIARIEQVIEKQPSQDEIGAFMLELGKYQPKLHDFFQHEYGQKLEKLMEQHGVKRPDMTEEVEKLKHQFVYTNNQRLFFVTHYNGTSLTGITNDYRGIKNTSYEFHEINQEYEPDEYDMSILLEKIAKNYDDFFGRPLNSEPYGPILIELMKKRGIEYPPPKKELEIEPYEYDPADA